MNKQNQLRANVVSLVDPKTRFEKLFVCAAKKFGNLSVSFEGVEAADVYLELLKCLKAAEQKLDVSLVQKLKYNKCLYCNQPADTTIVPMLIQDSFLMCLDLAIPMYDSSGNHNPYYFRQCKYGYEFIFPSEQPKAYRILLFSDSSIQKFHRSLNEQEIVDISPLTINDKRLLQLEGNTIKYAYSQWQYLIQEFHDEGN